MLPGLIYDDTQKLFICNISNTMRQDMLNSKQKRYTDYISLCSYACNKLHLREYLMCYKVKNVNYDLPFLKECKESSDEIVRLCSIKHLTKYYFATTAKQEKVFLDEKSEFIKILLKRFIFDSSNEVRKYILKIIRTRSIPIDESLLKDLIISLNDENIKIKINSLKLINQAKFIGKKNADEIYKHILRLIVDNDMNVRRLSAKFLRRVSNFDKKKLFDKHYNGCIVYGLEDECAVVRMTTIKSIYHLFDTSIHEEAFDFLVDLLNDDSEDVRIYASKVIKKLSRKCFWRISESNLRIVIINIGDVSEEMSRNLYEFCGNIQYTTETFFIFSLFCEKLKFGVDLCDIYRSLKRMAKNNYILFYSCIDEIYSYMDKNIDMKYINKMNIKNSLITNNSRGSSLLANDSRNTKKAKDDIIDATNPNPNPKSKKTKNSDDMNRDTIDDMNRIYISKIIILNELKKKKFTVNMSRTDELNLKIAKNILSQDDLNSVKRLFEEIKSKYLKLVKNNKNTPKAIRKFISKIEDQSIAVFIKRFNKAYKRFSRNKSETGFQKLEAIYGIDEFINLEENLLKVKYSNIQLNRFKVKCQKTVVISNTMISFCSFCNFSSDKNHKLKITEKKGRSLYFRMNERIDIKIADVADIDEIYLSIVYCKADIEIQVTLPKVVKLIR